jgi:hypothetical protein
MIVYVIMGNDFPTGAAISAHARLVVSGERIQSGIASGFAGFRDGELWNVYLPFTSPLLRSCYFICSHQMSNRVSAFNCLRIAVRG